MPTVGKVAAGGGWWKPHHEPVSAVSTQKIKKDKFFQKFSKIHKKTLDKKTQECYTLTINHGGDLNER